MNTHWDDVGLESRSQSAKVILHEVHKRTRAGALVVLVGDLNSPASEQGYQTLTGNRYLSPAQLAPLDSYPASFLDARRTVQLSLTTSSTPAGPLLYHYYGESATFTGFARTDRSGIIDFILLLDNGAAA